MEKAQETALRCLLQAAKLRQTDEQLGDQGIEMLLLSQLSDRLIDTALVQLFNIVEDTHPGDEILDGLMSEVSDYMLGQATLETCLSKLDEILLEYGMVQQPEALQQQVGG